MSDFHMRIYDLVARIPRGRVATYGQIAAILGNPLAARSVGEAMRNTPEYMDIPCHRVVNKAGKTAPAYSFGGEGRQREILESEGIGFKDNGCIDMKKYLWRL